MSPLITVAELYERRNDPLLAIADGSWQPAGGEMRADYARGHIERAVFLDLEAASDHRSALPHMLPTPDAFADHVGAHGIGNAHEVVVYDRVGCFSSARWWWMFRAFGHEKTRVLDGGLPAWFAAGHEVTARPAEPPPQRFQAVLQPKRLATRDHVEDQLAKGGAVLDARSPGRFCGREKETRAGLRSGHMPGTINLHYASVLNPDGTFRTPVEIRAMVPGLKPDSLIITTCGSGVTACIIALALEIAGFPDIAVYDGSWAEWGAGDSPVVAA